MPWCPKCKIEYVEGMTVCNDCGTELVEELPEELYCFMETEKEKLAEKFVQFLQYSDIASATYEYDEEKNLWIVKVAEDSVPKVKKLYNAFYTVELGQELSNMKEDSSEAEGIEEENDDDSFETLESEVDPFDIPEDNESMFDKEELKEILNNSEKEPVKSVTYVKKEEQYKDFKSSGYTFLIVSILGIVFLFLNIVGVVQIFNGLLAYIVMSILFIVFFVIGVQSLSSAKKVKEQAAEENRITKEINDWLSQNVTMELLNSLTSEETNEEIQFFKKLEKMKEMIIGQFGEMNDSYLDLLVEEFYNNTFEQ